MKSILGIALLACSASAAPIAIDGAFSIGGAERWSVTGDGFSFSSTQGQTSLLFTECIAGEPCPIDGRIEVARWGGEGDARATEHDREFRAPFLAGFLTWSGPLMRVLAEDIPSERNTLARSVPVKVEGRLEGFHAGANGMPGAQAFSYRLAGTGRLMLSSVDGGVTPRRAVGLAGDGSFQGTATADSAVPEPGTMALFGLGALALGLLRRRRARA
jgi:hypothetical protein